MGANVTSTMTNPVSGVGLAEDVALLAKAEEAARAAGVRLLTAFTPDARPADRDDIYAAAKAVEQTSMPGLRAALAAARPGAGWVDDELETRALPPGEWWAVDPVEGGVNHVHGMPEWSVTVTLLRDSEAVLTVVHQPVGDLTYTAVRGAGARLNGRLLHVSAKTDLRVAIATTGQALAGQDGTYRRIGDSVTAMLDRALLVRATVPCTFPLLAVAAGHYDLFWQYEPELSGIAAGMLLAEEAGAVVSDVAGRPWRPGGGDVLIAAPGVHAQAVGVLASVK